MKTNLHDKFFTDLEKQWVFDHLEIIATPDQRAKFRENRKPGNLNDAKRIFPERFRKVSYGSTEVEYAGSDDREELLSIQDYLEELQKVKDTFEKELRHVREDLSTAWSALSKQNAALIKSENELEGARALVEQFTFLSNHNLQEPLRKLQMFADLLAGPQANLNDYARKYSEKINVAAVGMSLLVKDLLHFSVTRETGPENFVPVDLNKILTEVTQGLGTAIQEKNAAVHCDILPLIHGDPHQIRQLFENLLSNALTFNFGNAVIDIFSSEVKENVFLKYPDLNPKTNYVSICVQDNGIGFDEKYSTKIFTLFQRLQGEIDVSGSGAGLSLCKQIVENHGGLIFADGKKNAGATFTLFFPISTKRR